VEVRCSLSHSAVADARAVAQGQAGEAAAVTGHRGQAGVRDLRQHGERQAAQVWVTQHLRRGETVLSPAFLHQTKTFGSPPPPHLGDAAVGELGAGGEVQLLQPVQS